MHVLDVVVRCQYSLCEMGKTTGVIDTNLGIARQCCVFLGWCVRLIGERGSSCLWLRDWIGEFWKRYGPGTRVEGVACAKTTPVTAGTCTFDCMNKAIQCMGFKHKFVVTYICVHS